MKRTDVHTRQPDTTIEPDYLELALAIRSLIAAVKTAEAKYELAILAGHYESLARLAARRRDTWRSALVGLRL